MTRSFMRTDGVFLRRGGVLGCCCGPVCPTENDITIHFRMTAGCGCLPFDPVPPQSASFGFTPTEFDIICIPDPFEAGHWQSGVTDVTGSYAIFANDDCTDEIFAGENTPHFDVYCADGIMTVVVNFTVQDGFGNFDSYRIYYYDAVVMGTEFGSDYVCDSSSPGTYPNVTFVTVTQP